MEKIINFTKYRLLCLILSVSLIVIFWVGTFLQGGFNFGIDFKSGLNQRVVIEKAESLKDVKSALSGLDALQVQTVGDKSENQYMIRVGIDGEDSKSQTDIEGQVKQKLEASYGKGAVKVLSTEFVGARFAGTLASQTVLLTVIALLLILVYVWFRFKLNYAVSAIVAVAHDVLFLMGFIGITQLEFSTATIAAVLTIIGYSLNDTIVIFDRIRENTRLVKDKFSQVINISISQSLSRTLITSLTTFIAVFFIFILGTGTIKTFALSLIVGIIVGTYSSIYIASSILLSWHDAHAKKVHEKLVGAKDVKKVQTVSEKPEEKSAPVNQVKMSAEEIAKATEEKKKNKLKKKKKKK